MTAKECRREKLKNAIIYFIKNDSAMTLVKLMKLLFYADFRLYRECGESLSGQTYEAWRFGPVPVDVWRELRKKQDCSLKLDGILNSSVLSSLPLNENEAPEIKITLQPKVKFCDDHFTGLEMRALKNISETFKGVSTKLTVQASHELNKPWDITYKSKGEKAVIDYDLALEGLDKEQIEHIHEIRDDALFMEALFAC